MQGLALNRVWRFQEKPRTPVPRRLSPAAQAGGHGWQHPGPDGAAPGVLCSGLRRACCAPGAGGAADPGLPAVAAAAEPELSDCGGRGDGHSPAARGTNAGPQLLPAPPAQAAALQGPEGVRRLLSVGTTREETLGG